jgi:sugar (pentulose or hexulose) kinase
MIPDLINYFLTDNAVCNYTTTTTSQLLDARKRSWAFSLIEAMGIPTKIFPEIVQPGEILDKLQPSITDELGIPELPVISVASHDTASAYAAVPSEKDDVLTLSSGTWGLMGVIIPEPIINKKTLNYSLSNEGSVFNTIRLLSVNPNLWLLQECRRIWEQEGEAISWKKIITAAEDADPFLAFINPSDDFFTLPEYMPTSIQQYCKSSKQRIPITVGEITRVCLESLVFQYRLVKDRITNVLGKNLSTLHIVSGGSKNKLLNQFAANACGMTVIAGPTEPAVLGNIIMQMIAKGEISGLEEGKSLIAKSFPTKIYYPEECDLWNERYQEFLMKTKINAFM